MKLPAAVIEKLRDKESPVTHAAVFEGGEMTNRLHLGRESNWANNVRLHAGSMARLVPFNDGGNASCNTGRYKKR
jgi:hypothetical protein